MRKLRAVLAAIALLLSAAAASAQVLRSETLTQDDGLSQNFVNAVVQDTHGFLWIGTQDGLNRFDGYEFRTFRPDGSEGALQDGHVRALHAARDGAVWVGTREGGLSRWNPASEIFETWQHDEKKPASISFDFVNAILENADGTFWIGTLEGLNHFDPKTGTFRVYKHDDADPASLTVNEIQTMFRDASGTIWISLRDGSLESFVTPGKFRHHTPQLAAAGMTEGVLTMANAGGGRTYFGTPQGLLVYDPAGDRFERVAEVGADVPVTSLLADRAGALWIGTRGRGVLRRDPKSARLRELRHDPADAHSIPSDSVEELYQDRTGVVWIGTQVGLASHNPATGAFRVHRSSANTADGPASSYVWAIESDRDGNIWTGSDGGGLSLFDRAAGTWQSWAARPEDPNALVSDSVIAVLIDRAGVVWAGGNRGLSRFDRTTGRFESWTKEKPAGLPHHRIFELFETRDGALLVGTSRGLAQWDPATRTFVAPMPELRTTVFTMSEDRDGAIWLGTWHNGLYRYDRKTNSVTRLEDANKQNLILQAQISATLIDSRGRLWVGTSQGLFRRDPGARTVRQFRVRDGLPNASVMGIVEDARGQLWFSTNDGMARHDPERGTFHQYKTRDGLPSNEFNQMAAGRTPRGEILLGTPSGAVIFDPAELAPDQNAPQVAITGFELFNAPVPIGQDSKQNAFSLAQSILTTRQLTLSHREKVVTLTFAGLHFAAPADTRYAYKLEGWDDDWREAPSARRAATYTNLPPGNYVFRVRAANKDGVWNEQGASVAIRVLPPWWKTWWAYAAYVLAILAAIFAFFRVRTRALRERQRELEALVQVRTSELERANQAKSVFLANMSHELRTPLNAVLGFAQLLERSPAVRGDDRSGLQIIRRAGEHLLGLINDVLSLSKIEAGRLALDAKPFSPRELLRAVEAMMRTRAEKAGLRFVVGIDGELPDAVEGDEGKLRQILVNLLGNAIKFTERGAVTLRASWRDGRAHFEVSDTGHGISSVEQASLFEAFVQTESGRKTKEGTGLGLVITREIVRLMQGDIAVRSELGAGSTFSFDVALPLAAGAVIRSDEAERVIGLAPGERPRRVLIADDTPENRLLIVRLLGSVGLEVIEASNGEEALRAWEREHPDLVLMDMRMPVLDGRDATRRMRETERARQLARTPVVALTASAFEHERDDILASGADDFMTKPFREEHLFYIIEKYASVRFARAAAAEEESTQPAATQGVTREHIIRLGAEESARLREALESGEVEKAAEVATKIRLRDEALGRELLADLRAFRIDHLLDLLEQESGHA